MNPTIRPVCARDQAEWVRLRSALWPDENDTTHSEEVAVFLATDTFHGSEALLTWKVFVAERPHGGLCGFVEVSLRPFVDDCTTHPVGYIEGWYVDPDLRRQRIGGLLLAAAEQWATAHGCQEMASDAHLDNHVSHQAHLAHGFAESSRRMHFRKPLPAAPTRTMPDDFVLPRLHLLGVNGLFAVCKLKGDAAVPAWATTGEFFTITRTTDELSVVCRQDVVPAGVVCERAWRCLRVAGTMPFTLVGVLAALTTPVARAGIGVFALSTFDTDYLFVKAEQWQQAVAALRAAGHTVERVSC